MESKVESKVEDEEDFGLSNLSMEESKESKDGDDEGDPFAVLKENRNKLSLSFPTIKQSVPAFPVHDIVGQLCAAITADGNAEISKAVAVYASKLLSQAQLDVPLCRVSDITVLKVKKKAKKKTAAEQSRQRTANHLLELFNKDYHLGRSRLDDTLGFLQDYCEPRLIPTVEWRRTKEASELQLAFEAELNSFNKDTPFLDLAAKAKGYISFMARSEAETMKGAFFIGPVTDFLRGIGAETWNNIVKELGMSKTTLHSYQILYKFLAYYPRFLRVRIAYTALLKYSKKLVELFNANPELKAVWSDLEA